MVDLFPTSDYRLCLYIYRMSRSAVYIWLPTGSILYMYMFLSIVCQWFSFNNHNSIFYIFYCRSTSFGRSSLHVLQYADREHINTSLKFYPNNDSSMVSDDHSYISYQLITNDVQINHVLTIRHHTRNK